MTSTPILLDGKATSDTIRTQQLQPQCAAFVERYGRPVGLAVVVVGARKDSATYVRMKQKACRAAGIESWKIQISWDENSDEKSKEEVTNELLKTIKQLNARQDVDGIIVQLPLPSFCDEDAILATIDPKKDVDGLHPENHAKLFQFATKKASSHEEAPFALPCTPAGCLELLDHYEIPLEGKHVVVLGRSQIVGLPVSLLCLQRNATVTICHSRTQDLKARVLEADIIIAAIGQPHFVQGNWIKPGATVIDVGINPVEDTSKKSGYRLVGDVHFDAAVKVAHAITPVPGGIGPMTVAMLLKNTIQCAKRREQQQ
ncbi:Bifunctional folD protein [Phytophthora megakarya]|uniref:Bifunctional folD protein n=1 Tax=Phytophthora megakarya TaxID=4795 RepID=A0A225WQS7_9STRA|nr:Bifunctional folD protein [Phytophthora megakarya]